MRALVHYLKVRLSVLPLVETLVLLQSMFIGYEIRMIDDNYLVPSPQAFIFIGLLLLSMTALGLYDLKAQTLSFRQMVQRLLSAYVLSLAGVTVVFFAASEPIVGRSAFALASLFGLLGLLGVRFAAYHAGILSIPSGRLLVLGDGQDALEVVSLLNERRGARAARFGALVPVADLASSSAAGSSDDGRNLFNIIKQRRISEVVVAVRERRGGLVPLSHLLKCKLRGLPVIDLVTFYEREQGLIKLDYLRASWFIFGAGFDQGYLRATIKRSFDVIVSSLILLLTLPVMLLAALAVFADGGRPVFFRQERVGAGDSRFVMLKFRSMRRDAESDGKPRWASTTDDRITRVGHFIRRTRIDELPQLINVLRGDMSFVGPRPEREFFVRQLVEQIPFYDVRHNVKPGITGWAQVRLPYGASVEDAMDKLQYDLYYVKNHSLFLDIMILFETIQVVLRRKGSR